MPHAGRPLYESRRKGFELEFRFISFQSKQHLQLYAVYGAIGQYSRDTKEQRCTTSIGPLIDGSQTAYLGICGTADLQ